MSARYSLFRLTRSEQITRLQELLDSPPLTLTAVGGGFPQPLTLVPEQCVCLTRAELENIVALLQKGGAA